MEPTEIKTFEDLPAVDADSEVSPPTETKSPEKKKRKKSKKIVKAKGRIK